MWYPIQIQHEVLRYQVPAIPRNLAMNLLDSVYGRKINSIGGGGKLKFGYADGDARMPMLHVTLSFPDSERFYGRKSTGLGRKLGSHKTLLEK